MNAKKKKFASLYTRYYSEYCHSKRKKISLEYSPEAQQEST